MVKRPNSATDILGKKVKKDGVTYAVALEDDLLAAATSQMNNPFVAWQQALMKLKQGRSVRGKAGRPEGVRLAGRAALDTSGFKTKRLAYGDDDAFSFLHDEGSDVQVLGPITERVGNKDALRYLKTPGTRRNVRVRAAPPRPRACGWHKPHERGAEGAAPRVGGFQPGDPGRDPSGSECDLESLFAREGPAARRASGLSLKPRSGDESVAKEYIHPRAGRVGANRSVFVKRLPPGGRQASHSSRAHSASIHAAPWSGR